MKAPGLETIESEVRLRPNSSGFSRRTRYRDSGLTMHWQTQTRSRQVALAIETKRAFAPGNPNEALTVYSDSAGLRPLGPILTAAGQEGFSPQGNGQQE